MTSVHSTQPGGSFSSTNPEHRDPYKEKNMDNMGTSLKEKIEDLMEFCEAAKFGMMTTRQASSGMLMSRCMAMATKENGIDMLFHTNTETGKTDELVSDPHVNLAFLKSSTGEWASISGVASIETDRERVRKYYTPSLKAWVGDLGDKVHDGGPEDPRLAVIKVHAKTATYALQKGNAISRKVEVAKGAVTGQAASTNKLREITEEEINTYRNSQQMVS